MALAHSSHYSSHAYYESFHWKDSVANLIEPFPPLNRMAIDPMCKPHRVGSNAQIGDASVMLLNLTIYCEEMGLLEDQNPNISHKIGEELNE